MRYVLAFVLACLSFPALAQECVTKEMHLALMAEKYPKAITTDLEGELEKIVLANLSRMTGEDYLAYDLMIHRHPGVGTTLLVLFKDGCAALKGEFPNNAFRSLIGPEA